MKTDDILIDIRDALQTQNRLRAIGMLYRNIPLNNEDKMFLEEVANGAI